MARIALLLVKVLLLSPAALSVTTWAGVMPETAGHLPLLTTARQVREMDPEMASLGYPVTLRGVVTFYFPERNLLFLQDQTGGVYVYAKERVSVKAGELVELNGKTDPGSFSSIVASRTLRVLGRGRFPANRPTSVNRVVSGEEDCQWVTVEGVVRQALVEEIGLSLEIMVQGVRLRATVLDYQGGRLAASRWVDSKLQLSGVCATFPNRRRELTGVALMVPSHHHVTALRTAAADPFSPPATSIASLADSARLAEVFRKSVRGVVVSRGGDNLKIRDGTGIVEVQIPHPREIQPGNLVEVAGFPVLESSRILLEDAVVKPLTAPDNLEKPAKKPAVQGGILHSAAKVRALSPTQAAEAHPVRLEGVATYYDPSWQTLFVQDATAGIYVRLPDSSIDLQSGKRVVVEGHTDAGDYAPIVVAGRIWVAGEQALPKPLPASLDRLFGGVFDSQWIEIKGIVRTVAVEWEHLFLGLATGSGRINVVVPGSGNMPLPTHLVDCEVRLNGVCATLFNQSRQLAGIRLFVPSLAHFFVERPAPDPFRLPVLPIGDILSFRPETSNAHRVRVTGTVTLQLPDGTLFIADETGGLKALSSQRFGLEPGDVVEVVGFPAAGQLYPVLQEALFLRSGKGPLPKPVEISAEDALNGRHAAELVQIQARLLDQVRLPDEELLVLDSEKRIFNAVLRNQTSGALLNYLDKGSILLLTGVCEVQTDELQQPRAFRLLLRGSEDIAVLQSPPWWSSRHSVTLLAIAAALVLSAFGWVWALRRRVREQTELVRRRLEREAAFEERYKLLFENANDLIQSAAPDGRLLYVNPAWRRILGYDEQDVDLLSIRDIVPAQDHPLWEDVFRKVLAGEKVAKFESVFLTRSGGRVFVDGSCTCHFAGREEISIQGIFHDITERKQAAERFLKAFRASPTSISITTLENGSFLDVNDGFVKTWGYSREEVIGLTETALQLWARPEERQHVLRLIREQKPVRDFEAQLVTRAGERRTALISIESIEEAGQSCLLTIAHDVTERANLESQLRQAQKMESIGQLASGVAHDFNNILTVIEGHAGLLLDDPSLGYEARDSAKQVANAARRAADLTRQLLTFSRKQFMKRVTLDLNSVIENVSQLLRRLLGENIDLKFEFSQDLPWIEADEGMLEQVLLNLSVNGRDAMPKGGKLIVRTERVSITEEWVRRNPEASPGSFVCLSVSDTGLGMAPEVIGRIFDPFFTTKETGKGTGLGLATVYGIVKQHQGWIEVSSSVGEGATFRIFIPCSKAKRAQARRRTAPGSPTGSGGSETVLVVEDERVLRDLVKGILEASGYRVLLASCANEALEVWQAAREEIDLLLTDMVMPGSMTGWDLAEKLRQEKPELKVICTSGYSNDMVGGKAGNRNILFLQKPYHPHKLTRSVRDSLDSRAGKLSTANRASRQSRKAVGGGQ
jgi:two-component system, cell cycle sensor histidine kinase and response regulator CckA